MNSLIELAAEPFITIPGLRRAAGAPFVLPPLPYPENALEPVVSSRALQLHYRKQHGGYVNTLNRLVAATPLADLTLTQLLFEVAGKPDQALIFNNAAQVWNHSFYWQSLSPNGGGVCPQVVRALIEYSFGGLESLKEQVSSVAASQFGSGWVWLVLDGECLRVLKTSNADNPLLQGLKPLLAIDLWEHAYYPDFENRRGEYIAATLAGLINWDFAADNLSIN